MARRQREPSQQRIRAQVQGNFNRSRPNTGKIPASSVPTDFVAAAPHQINAGMKVRHLKFGEGKVLNVDGYNDAKVATIFFEGVENPQRRIMLKFAKLQILDQ